MIVLNFIKGIAWESLKPKTNMNMIVRFKLMMLSGSLDIIFSRKEIPASRLLGCVLVKNLRQGDILTLLVKNK